MTDTSECAAEHDPVRHRYSASPTPDKPPELTPFANFLVRNRWIFVVPLLLPAAKVFSAWRSVRTVGRELLRGSASHDRRVARLQAQVRAEARNLKDRSGDAPALLCTGTKEWQSVATPREDYYKRTARPVRLDLTGILGLDADRQTVRVEPGVTMGRLIDHLVRRGWTLPVVPELEALTVGGLTMGFGIETSSHHHGLFADTVESYEVLLGTGEVVRASRTEHKDLFHALPWSRGSLGFLVAVELRIVPAHAWVRVEYHPAVTVPEMCRAVTRLAGAPDGPEFVEGFVHSCDEAVVVTGEFADEVPAGARRNHVCRWYKPWFYLHARDRARVGGAIEYMPLKHYYRRHSRSMFWAGELLVPFGNHPLFRLLCGWLMRPDIAFLKLTETRKMRRRFQQEVVTQEAMVPARHLQGLVDLCHRTFDVGKLWVCPVSLTRTDPAGAVGPSADVAPGERELFMDVAVIYDVPGPVRRREPWNPRAAIRQFESWVGEHNGFQVPYVLSGLSRTEYRQMFDCTLHDRVRKTYGAEGVFVDAYDKITAA